jgi:hypothetical protein
MIRERRVHLVGLKYHEDEIAILQHLHPLIDYFKTQMTAVCYLTVLILRARVADSFLHQSQTITNFISLNVLHTESLETLTLEVK